MLLEYKVLHLAASHALMVRSSVLGQPDILLGVQCISGIRISILVMVSERERPRCVDGRCDAAYSRTTKRIRGGKECPFEWGHLFIHRPVLRFEWTGMVTCGR